VKHVARDLEQLDDVVKIDDLHVSTITSGMDAMNVHLEVRQGSDMHDVLNRARALLRDHHHITHATNPGRTLRPQGLQRRTVVSPRYLEARMP
jgi:Co/Zn/Cd efflux system component